MAHELNLVFKGLIDSGLKNVTVIAVQLFYPLQDLKCSCWKPWR